MAGHALLGGVDKPQADLVARHGSRSTQCKRGSVEQGVQATGFSIKLGQSRLAPSQMVCFLLRGTEKLLARLIRAGGQCLSLIQGLRADLSCVVHPHQARSMLTLLCAQRRLFVADCRRGPRCGLGQ